MIPGDSNTLRIDSGLSEISEIQQNFSLLLLIKLSMDFLNGPLRRELWPAETYNFFFFCIMFLQKALKLHCLNSTDIGGVLVLELVFRIVAVLEQYWDRKQARMEDLHL